MARGKVVKRSTKSQLVEVNWPCTVCEDASVFCSVCKGWSHALCQAISKEDLKMLPKIRTGYICLKCCCGNDGFDFAQSLCRLKKAATSSGLKLLEHAVNMEKILLKDIHMEYLDKTVISNSYKIDPYSYSVINSPLCGTAEMVPLNVRGDGNCLFNAASIASMGNESDATELRVRTCCQFAIL